MVLTDLLSPIDRVSISPYLPSLFLGSSLSATPIGCLFKGDRQVRYFLTGAETFISNGCHYKQRFEGGNRPVFGIGIHMIQLEEAHVHTAHQVP